VALKYQELVGVMAWPMFQKNFSVCFICLASHQRNLVLWCGSPCKPSGCFSILVHTRKYTI
jgi:hypothetical protein